MANVTYKTFDKNNKKISEGTYICFAPLLTSKAFQENAQFFEYHFDCIVPEEKAYNYFLFLKSIPEFKPFMPLNIKKMLKDRIYRVNLEKINGSQLLTMLTVIRAVSEFSELVNNISKFNRKFKYSINNLGILKAVGSVYCTNTNHWITEKGCHIEDLNLGINPIESGHWNSNRPAKQTGLLRGIHQIWMNNRDGYVCVSPVQKRHIDNLIKEPELKNIKAKDRVDTVIKSIRKTGLAIANNDLQLDF